MNPPTPHITSSSTPYDASSAYAPAGYRRIRVLFPDQYGFARGKYVPASAAGDDVSFSTTIFGVGYDRDLIPAPGAEVLEGMGDMTAHYLADDVRPSWEEGVGVVIASLQRNGKPLAICPRHAAERAVEGFAAAAGGSPRMGVELEAYVLQRDPDGRWVPWDTPGAHCYGTGALADPVGLIEEILDAAERCGIPVETAASEYDNAQFELTVAYGEAMAALDNAFLLKLLCREVAQKRGLRMTFLGRPLGDRGGNGTHIHLSVQGGEDDPLDPDIQAAATHADPSRKDKYKKQNLYSDKDADDGLSTLARRSIAGLLAHHEALSALCAPTVNAYKRLMPGQLAGYWANWGYDHRSAAVRVPPGREMAARLEHRLADGAANVYLAAAAMLTGARLGIEEKLDPPPPEESDGLETANTERCVPENLALALDALEADTAVIEAFGPEVIAHFAAMKRAEWARYARAVTDWELNEYLAFH